MNTHFALRIAVVLLASLTFVQGQIGNDRNRGCWVQEVHYNNFFLTRNEFIEVACREGTDASGWTLHLYRNRGGVEIASYSFSDDMTFTNTNEGLLLYVLEVNRIRTGGVVLVDGDDEVLEFTSFGGQFVAFDGVARGFQSVDTGVEEGFFNSAGNSLQLLGTGCAPTDYVWSGPLAASSGQINVGQVLTCSQQPSYSPSNRPTVTFAPSLSPSMAPTFCGNRCFFSCEEARATVCGLASGTIEVCPLRSTQRTTVYCDQETERGGWMLIYAYNHIGGENDPLVPDVIPTSPLGYSHFFVNQIAGYSKEDIEAVKFYCRTSNHERIMHFINTSPVVRSVAFDGDLTNNVPGVWVNSSTILSDHDAVLPFATDGGDRGAQDGFHKFPFFNGGNFHWSIYDSTDGRWECDDTTFDADEDTLHTVYVRLLSPSTSRQPSAAPTGCEVRTCYYSCAEALEVACNPVTGLVELCPAGINGKRTTVYCDQDDAGGGWMLLYSYNHLSGVNENLESNIIPLDPFSEYNHFFVEKIPGYSEDSIEALRFYCTTSRHNRTIHFYTTDPRTFGLAWNGDQRENVASAWVENTVLLTEGTESGLFGNHTANLPLSTNNVDALIDGGLSSFPFFTDGNYHWALRGGGNRWECDDFVGDADEDTLHIVWVRMKAKP